MFHIIETPRYNYTCSKCGAKGDLIKTSFDIWSGQSYQRCLLCGHDNRPKKNYGAQVYTSSILSRKNPIEVKFATGGVGI